MRIPRSLRVGTAAALATATLATLSLAGPLASTQASASALPCSPANLPSSGKVHITFWEEMSSANETAIQALTKAFNNSQSKVVVTDDNITTSPGGYVGGWDQYYHDVASDPSGEPNVLMLDQYITQGAVDTKSTIPVSECVTNTKDSLTKFAPKVIQEETVNGKLQGMPYSVSAPILIYNEYYFTSKGFKPPTTVAQLIADAKSIKNKSYVCTAPSCDNKGLHIDDLGKKYTATDGITLPVDPWYLQVWLGTGGAYFVNNSNGRALKAGKSEVATAAGFTSTNSIAEAVFTDLQNLAKAGDCTFNLDNTGNINTDYANLFSIGSGASAMSIDSSATLGTILKDLPVYPNVKLGVAEMPSILSSASGGVEPGGNALFLPSAPNQSPAQLAASWEFIEYLTNATNMATWDKATGYVPIRSDAYSNKTMVSFYKEYPTLKAAYNEIFKGKVNAATEGPLLGNYYQVEDDITQWIEKDIAFGGGGYPSAQSALASAVAGITHDIQNPTAP